MPGRVIRLATKTAFNFGKIQNAQTQVYYLARRLDVSQATEAGLLFRLHTGTFGAGMTVVLGVGVDGYTDEDPSVMTFVGGGATVQSPGATFCVSPNLQAMTAGSIFYLPINQSTAIAGGFGPLITVLLTVTQPAGAVSADITFSCDLSLKW